MVGPVVYVVSKCGSTDEVRLLNNALAVRVKRNHCRMRMTRVCSAPLCQHVICRLQIDIAEYCLCFNTRCYLDQLPNASYMIHHSSQPRSTDRYLSYDTTNSGAFYSASMYSGDCRYRLHIFPVHWTADVTLINYGISCVRFD